MAFGFDDILNFGSSALGFYSQQETNRMNRDISRETNQFNAGQSQLNRDFQERMSSTAYQRAKQDMLAAGFNPILAVSQGGASSPGGSSASGTTGAPMVNPASSAIDALKVRFEMANLAETNRKIKSDTDLNKALSVSAAQDALLKGASARKVKADARIVENAIPGSTVESDIDRTTAGKVMRWSNRLTDAASSALSLMNPFTSLFKAFAHSRSGGSRSYY